MISLIKVVFGVLLFAPGIILAFPNEPKNSDVPLVKPPESSNYFKLYYYNKDDPSTPHESDSKNPFTFTNDNLKTVFVMHGYNTKNLEKPEKYKDAVFEGRQDVGRVVVVDWSKDSTGPYGIVIRNGAANTVINTANELKRIVNSGMTTSNNIEIAGHSLGSHIAGQSARLVKEEIGEIPLITGMDPPSIGFSKGDVGYGRGLQVGDANKVLVIHTNSRTLGTKESLGDEDIWVNGGKVQPECKDKFLWKQDQCSHSAAWDYGAMAQKGIPLYDPNDPSRGKNYKPAKRMSVNILVLDVSPSMEVNGRIDGLVVSSTRFVRDLPLGYHLGIIIFGGSARESSPVVNVSSESVRKSLLSALPNIHTQIMATSIGAGLQAAINSAKRVSASCPDFILITDGDENHYPYIRDVYPDLVKSCSKVNAIALGPQADSQLEQLSASTKGKMFSVSDENKDFSVFDSLTESLLDSSNAQMDPDSRPIKLPQKNVPVDSPDPVTYNFDKSIGKDTKFTISSSNIDRIEAEFVSPEGITYGSRNYDKNKDTLDIVFNLEDVVPGDWAIKLKTKDDEQNGASRKKRYLHDAKQYATISVTTNPRNSDEAPIRLEAVLNSTTMVYPDWIKIEAVVRKGDFGIINADVIASIRSPEGNISTLKLRDDGAGADDMKGDGIYSRFITYLSGPGRYEVFVVATDGGNNAMLVENGKLKELEKFERFANVASLKAEGNFVKPPPAAVRDLKIVNIDLEKHTVKLSWTAPGNEADEGTATSYIIKVGTSYGDSIDDENQYEFTTEDLEDKERFLPLPAGEEQIVVVTVPENVWREATTPTDQEVPAELYFTVFTVNSESRLSDTSNIANSAHYFQLISKAIQMVQPVFLLLFVTAFTAICQWCVMLEVI